MVESLEKVTIVKMRRYIIQLFYVVYYSNSSILVRYSRCSRHFTDAYCQWQGLTGKKAAWAVKKYCGHHMPATLMEDMEKERLR